MNLACNYDKWSPLKISRNSAELPLLFFPVKDIIPFGKAKKQFSSYYYNSWGVSDISGHIVTLRRSKVLFPKKASKLNVLMLSNISKSNQSLSLYLVKFLNLGCPIRYRQRKSGLTVLPVLADKVKAYSHRLEGSMPFSRGTSHTHQNNHLHHP